MRRVLLSIAVLLFLAAGAGGWLLYSISEKAIEQMEESIIELSVLEAKADESIIVEKPVGNEPDKIPEATKPKPEADIPAGIVPSSAPSDSISYSSTALNNENHPPEAVENEKDSLTELVLSKLTKKDISELKEMLTNGITAGEKKRAREILYSRFTAEEINNIKDAYIKYIQQN